MRTDGLVRVGGAATSPVWRADARLQKVPRWQWRTLRWRRGSPGWRRKQFVAVRCWRVTAGGQRHVGWLVGERATRGQPAELAGLAHRRQVIEPCHEEAKGAWGWDQDQGRLGPGFHRQAVTVMLACSVLVGLERQQPPHHTRPGRPGGPFAPSAPAPTTVTPRRAS